MSQKNPTEPPKSSDLQSGPQVIAAFLRTVETNASLDSETVQVLLKVYAAGLTTNNLTKALELARVEKKA